MSERKVDINLDATATASDTMTDVDKEINELMARTLSAIELKNRVAEVYERGVVGDRLHVDLPPELVGQWVPNDQQAIFRMESMGFIIDKKFAPARRLHDKGDGASYVGDVVHMIAPRIVRDVIDEVKRDRYQRVNAPKGGKQKEEKDFEAQQQTVSSAGIGTIAESKQHLVNTSAIEAAINPQKQ